MPVTGLDLMPGCHIPATPLREQYTVNIPIGEVAPPHNPTAEKSLLSLILADNDTLDRPDCHVPASDWYIPSHQEIYRAALEHHAAGRAFDLVTAGDTLADHPGAASILADIGTTGMTAAIMSHAPAYAASIRDAAVRRRVIRGAANLAALAANPAASIDDIEASRAAIASESIENSNGRFEWHTPADLDAGDFELEYLIDGILVAAQPAIMAGSQKTLKTNTSIDLTLSLATGHPFLGEFFVNGRMNAGIMTGESGAATVQETARRVARSKGWTLSSVEGMFVSFDIPDLTSPSSVAEIHRFIDKNDLRCLVVDPIYMAMSGVADNASNVFAMGSRLASLGDLVKQTGCAVVLCHHTRKTRENHFEPPKLEDIAFAGFQEFARQWLLLGRREAYDPEQPGSHQLWFEVGGSAGHAGRWGLDIEEGSRADAGGRSWSVDVRGGGDVLRERSESAADEKLSRKEAEAQRKEKAAIDKYVPLAIEVLKRHEYRDGATAKAIREELGCSNSNKSLVISFMMSKGLIEECECIGANGHSYPGYRLTECGQNERPGTSGNDRESIGHSRSTSDNERNGNDSPIGGEFPVPARSSGDDPASLGSPSGMARPGRFAEGVT